MTRLLDAVADMERRAERLAARRRQADEEALAALLAAQPPAEPPQASEATGRAGQHDAPWHHVAAMREAFPHRYGFGLSRLRGTAPKYNLPEWEDLNDNSIAVPDPCACPYEPEPRRDGTMMFGHSVTQPDPCTGLADCQPFGGPMTLAEAAAIVRQAEVEAAAEDVALCLSLEPRPFTADEVADLTDLDERLVLEALVLLRGRQQVARTEHVWQHGRLRHLRESEYLWTLRAAARRGLEGGRQH